MTKENETLLAEMFQRYGHPTDQAEITLRGYFVKADSINETDRIQSHDESAARMIRECQAVISRLTAYRLSLAERYNYLSVAPSIPVVRLERDKNSYDGKVYYYLRILRRFLDDKTEVEERREKYPGAERHKAIADYKAYMKAHPGITAEMDIGKKRWEK